MRTMYDAVTARNILRKDPKPVMVAGYVDKIRLEPWSAADWALFPDAIKVRIVKKASTQDGHVLDVEPGDATPAQAPGWVRMRRAVGADPTIYCNLSTWSTVQQAFRDQGVAQPHYWIAHYNNVVELPTLNGITAVAKQHSGDVPPGIDINCVANYWPGVDSVPGSSPAQPTHPAQQEAELMRTIVVTPPNANQNVVRVELSGTAGAAVIVRPKIGGDGFSKPMWVGNIFAWGSDKQGVGHNPTQVKGYDNKLTSHRRYELPDALWADIEYSAAEAFVIDCF